MCTRHPRAINITTSFPFIVVSVLHRSLALLLSFARTVYFFFTFILAACYSIHCILILIHFFSPLFQLCVIFFSCVLSLYFRCANTECVSVTNVHGQNHHIHLNNVLVFHQIWVLSCNFFFRLYSPSVASGHVYLSVQYNFFCHAYTGFFFVFALHCTRSSSKRQSHCVVIRLDKLRIIIDNNL